MLDPDRATAMLTDELARVDEGVPRVRHAELTAMLCLAGDVRTTGGHTTIRAEFGSPVVANRARDAVAALHGHAGVLDGSSPCRLRVDAPGSDLARATGLDRRGGALPDLPPSVLSGTATAAAIWRGALLARGVVARVRGRLEVQVVCSGEAVALTLIDAGRWLGLAVRDRETATRHRVLLQDPDSIDTLLRVCGAPRTADVLRGAPDVVRIPQQMSRAV